MNIKSSPFFSVVIPTYERADDLDRCLCALSPDRQLNCPEYEIIVTDDSKTKDTQNLVKEKFANVTWIQGKQNGPAGNRNKGASKAKGDWLIFIDDDCFAHEEILSKYKLAIKNNPKIKIFEGMVHADRPRRTWAEGCPQNEFGGMLWTCNICIKKDIFIQLNGFDELFHTSYEDVDFAHRIRTKNIKTLFVKEASVCHPWRSLRNGANKNWKNNYHDIQSLLMFCNKYKCQESHICYPYTYLRNFSRNVTKDLIECIFSLKFRGIDFLLWKALISLFVFFALLFK